VAGLLDYVNRAGQGLTGVLDRLVTPNIAEDPAMLEMMTAEQRTAAARQARSAGISAMTRAAATGAPWYALGAEQDVAAQPAYNAYVANAVKSVEELRKRRDDDGRRTRVADLVGRITNPEDPISQKYTPEQIAVLASLTPDQQAELLMKTEFPKQAGLSVATAGSIQKVVKLENGNIGVVIQTGDPASPVDVQDTGTRFVSELPSDIRSLLSLQQDPTLLATAEELKRRERTGTDTGAANVSAQVALPGLLANTRRHYDALSDLRATLAELPSGPISGRLLPLFSSQFQIATAQATSEGLLQIAALAQAGVRLNPITEVELRKLLETSPQLTNNTEANLRIIDERMKRMQSLLADLESQIAHIDAGYDITSWRPGQPPPPPRVAPASAYPASPVPTSNVPAPAPRNVPGPVPGGAGGVSTIPTIRKPGQ
jgi:hypothetical protein